MAEDTAIPSLAEYLAQIPEYCAARSTQHPLLALRLLICVAMLCGARGPSALAAWGKHHGRPWLRRLGSTQVAATCRLFMAQPLAAFLALGTRPDLE